MKKNNKVNTPKKKQKKTNKNKDPLVYNLDIFEVGLKKN